MRRAALEMGLSFRSGMRMRARTRGFTITETMLTVAVLVILLGLSMPGFRELILSQGVKTAGFDVFSSLVLARSEAISRNSTVTLTPSAGNWANGWTITDSTGEVLKRQDPFSQITIAGPVSVTFNGAGRVTTGSTSISLMASGSRGTYIRCISVELSGRPTARTEGCF